MAESDYVVLEVREAKSSDEAAERQSNVWYVEADKVTARSARDAVSSYVKANGVNKGGSFIAVPIRSFKPVTVAVETQTKLTFK